MVLAAGYYTHKVLALLAEAGFEVYAVDRDPNAYGAKIAHHFRPIDLTDATRVLAWAEEKKIDGIMPVSDFGVRTASRVAHTLGLVGLDLAKVDVVIDKGLMRDVWTKYGLPQPAYQVIHTFEELRKSVRQIEYPCVLKPTDCGGSGRGVSVIRSEDDLQWAYDFAKPFVKNGRFIVESFLEGIEMTIESFSSNDQVIILAMSDKEKPDLRTRVATSLNYPAAFSEETLDSVRKLVTEAVPALGIMNGMSHTEIMVTANGPKLVELGARGGGGHIFHTIIEAVSGFKAPVEYGKQLTGLPVTIPKLTQNGAVYRFFNPPRGILKEVRHLEAARQVPGVLDIGIVKKPGDMVGNLENSLDRVGFVVTQGQTREEAVERANQAENLIEFVLEAVY